MYRTIFEQVTDINTKFGNPKGDFKKINIEKIHSQCKNILDEYNELILAINKGDIEEIRDALCDIQVFIQGAQHMMGVNGDEDMEAVINGLKSRFIKSDKDLTETLQMHKNKGINKVYFEGEFPLMIMKSGEDQPDAPKGKFLKSASYSKPVFKRVD